MSEHERKLAVFIDVDNAFPRFDNDALRRLFDRLAAVGPIFVCRAYADWNALGSRTRETMRWAVTPVHLYTHGVQRKNAADIAVAVDAMEAMFLAPHLDTFVLVTGDADLAPLATRLKERGKTVIGFGRKASTSGFLVRCCSRFEYLDELPVPASSPPEPVRRVSGAKVPRSPRGGTRSSKAVPAPSAEEVQAGVALALDDLCREFDGPVHAGLLKTRLMQRVNGFRERDFGAKTFVAFLETYSEQLGIVIERTSAGGVCITRKGEDAEQTAEVVRVLDDRGHEVDAEDARDLLERAVATADPDVPANLAWVKETMLRMSPTFNERSLGYKGFLDFVRDHDDLVETIEVEPNRWGVLAAGDH